MRVLWCTPCLCSGSGVIVSQWKFLLLFSIGLRKPLLWRRPPLWFDMPTFRPCWGPSKVGHSRKASSLMNVTSYTYSSPLHEYVNVLMVLGETLAQASDFTPLFLQTLEKAVAQNSQHALLAEGVAASVLLSRLAMLETQTGETALSSHFSFSVNGLKNTVRMTLLAFCSYRSKVLQLLESGPGWEKVTFYYWEVPLPGKWWK